MRKTVCLFLALIQAGLIYAITPELDSLFRMPPQEAKPIMIWQWMDGVVSEEGITCDLEAYRDAGIGGVQQFQVGGKLQGVIRDTTNAIGSESWKHLMRHAIKECARLGLSFGTHNCPGWSSSASPEVKPEDSMQKLVWTDTIADGGKTLKLNLRRPQIDPRWNYYRDIALLAMPADSLVRQNDIIDLTGCTEWKPTGGKWRIIRFGHTTNGQTNVNTAPYGGVGLECDKMSLEAVRKYWRGYPTMLLGLVKEEDGRTFQRIEIDSYEAGPQSWTPLMPQEFVKRRGYNLLTWLPVLAGLTVESEEKSKAFKHDWNETITDLFAECYYGEMGRMARQIPGMNLLIQPYGKPLNTWKVAQQPGNLLCAEFWTRPNWGWQSIPSVVSSAHRLNRNLIYGEGFTCWPLSAWQDDPQSLKPIADHAFCAGINAIMLHAGAQNPWPNVKPGMTFGKWGTQFTPGQTWWASGGAKLFFQYLSRCQALLQAGYYIDCYTDAQKSVLTDCDSVMWIHRRSDNTDFYFIVNAQDKQDTVCVTVNVSKRIPELWYPDKGTMREAPYWKSTGKQTQVRLVMNPRESVFLVLRKPTHSSGTTLYIPPLQVIATKNISKEWRISFPPGWGAPEQLVKDSLCSWTEETNSGVRYFSGTARYKRLIKIDRISKQYRYILDLGEVKNLARVFVNGKEVDHLWKKPFRCDITDYIHPQTNTLEIDVTNLWVNRMVGDEQEPDDIEWDKPFVYDYAPGKPEVGRFMKEIPEWLQKGLPRPSQNRHTVVSFKFFKKNSPLLPSGLLGPVSIIILPGDSTW